MMLAEGLVWAGLLIWSAVLLLPWQPWRLRETLEPVAGSAPDLSSVTALVPARNEADNLGRTLSALVAQGPGLHVIVVDDQSDDDTAAVARRYAAHGVSVVSGRPLPAGWTGKLWALEQAAAHADTPRLLLLDADIELRPGMVAALLQHLERDERALVSVMAWLRMDSFWERLLMPAFVWFFRLLYPFALANRPGSRTAAAAGGCMLLRRDWLAAIGGFRAVRGALIDDCTLAGRIKRAGGNVWVGLTHGALSRRAFPRLADVSRMVSRTAFAQLRHSRLLLLLCAVLMLAAFPAPWLGLFWSDPVPRAAGAVAVGLSLALYTPILRFYRLSPAWAIGLPIAGCLYLAMTLASAWRHARGRGAHWRGREYTGPDLPG